MENNNFKAEVFHPVSSGWDKIKDDVISLEREAFGDNAFSDEYLSNDFQDTDNIIVTLKNVLEDKVIGFTYAKPIEKAIPERISEKGESVFMWDTVIKKEFRNQRLTPLLMNLLEKELKQRGYAYIEREASVENNYASNISKHYGDRVIQQSEVHPSMYGPQVFFRIKL